MEPPTPAATLAMTSSKAGWGSSSKAHHYDMMIIPLNQVDKMCPGEPEKLFHVDAEFFLSLLLQFPLRLQVNFFLQKLNCPANIWGQNYCDCLQEIRPVPVYCNQWGVKHLVPEHLGRRQYVRDLVNLFQVLCLYSRWSERHNFHENVFYQDYGIHSTYWIWRSYTADEWTGFEMVWSLTSFALQDSLMGGLVTQKWLFL